jgi:hypothetical protein
MAIALIQTAGLGANGGGSSQQTLSFGVPPTVGNTIVAWTWGWSSAGHGAPQASTFSDTGGNSYLIPVGASYGQNFDLWLGVGYARVLTAGASFKVTATPNVGSNSSIMVVASEFSGVAAASPVDGGAAVGANGSTGVPAPGNLSFGPGDLLVAVMARDSASFLGSTPTGWNRIAFQNDGAAFSVGEAIYAIDPASPTNPSWATSTTVWGASQFALLAEATGGPPADGGSTGGSGMQRPVAQGWV